MTKEALLKILAAHPDNRICEFWRGVGGHKSHLMYNVTLVEHNDFYHYVKETSSVIPKTLVTQVISKLDAEPWGHSSGIGGITYKLKKGV